MVFSVKCQIHQIHTSLSTYKPYKPPLNLYFNLQTTFKLENNGSYQSFNSVIWSLSLLLSKLTRTLIKYVASKLMQVKVALSTMSPLSVVELN